MTGPRPCGVSAAEAGALDQTHSGWVPRFLPIRRVDAALRPQSSAASVTIDGPLLADGTTCHCWLQAALAPADRQARMPTLARRGIARRGDGTTARVTGRRGEQRYAPRLWRRQTCQSSNQASELASAAPATPIPPSVLAGIPHLLYGRCFPAYHLGDVNRTAASNIMAGYNDWRAVEHRVAVAGVRSVGTLSSTTTSAWRA